MNSSGDSHPQSEFMAGLLPGTAMTVHTFAQALYKAGVAAGHAPNNVPNQEPRERTRCKGCLHLLDNYGPAEQVRPEAHALYPAMITHFQAETCPCQGHNPATGKPCDKRAMLVCRFCPCTKLPQLNGGEFAAWSNPIASNGSSRDMTRNAMGHAEGPRGWHQFWYAVHHLYEQQNGGAAGPPGPPGDTAIMQKQFLLKVPDYPAMRAHYNKAGLLHSDSSTGVHLQIIEKFMMADWLMRAMPEVSLSKKKKASSSPEDRSPKQLANSQ